MENKFTSASSSAEATANKKATEDKIKKILEKIRLGLQTDGGDVEFLGWEEKNGRVEVSLTGMCAHCPMSEITLKQGIETEIKKVVPEVKEVVNIPKI